MFFNVSSLSIRTSSDMSDPSPTRVTVSCSGLLNPAQVPGQLSPRADSVMLTVYCPAESSSHVSQFFPLVSINQVILINIRSDYRMFNLTARPPAALHKFRFAIRRKEKVDRIFCTPFAMRSTGSPDEWGVKQRAHQRPFSRPHAQKIQTGAHSRMGFIKGSLAHCSSQ